MIKTKFKYTHLITSVHITSRYVLNTCNSHALHLLVCEQYCSFYSFVSAINQLYTVAQAILSMWLILCMSNFEFLFHHLFIKISLFTGLLFARIGTIPHIDNGLDQELPLPKVMSQNLRVKWLKRYSVCFFSLIGFLPLELVQWHERISTCWSTCVFCG